MLTIILFEHLILNLVKHLYNKIMSNQTRCTQYTKNRVPSVAQLKISSSYEASIYIVEYSKIQVPETVI